jgi:hypothetical protein
VWEFGKGQGLGARAGASCRACGRRGEGKLSLVQAPGPTARGSAACEQGILGASGNAYVEVLKRTRAWGKPCYGARSSPSLSLCSPFLFLSSLPLPPLRVGPSLPPSPAPFQSLPLRGLTHGPPDNFLDRAAPCHHEVGLSSWCAIEGESGGKARELYMRSRAQNARRAPPKPSGAPAERGSEKN